MRYFVILYFTKRYKEVFMLHIMFYRKKNKLTQRELADKLFVNQNTVSQWETGRSEPPIDILIKLSDLFGCTIDELVRGSK